MKCEVSPARIKNRECFFTYESLPLAKVSSISTPESEQSQHLPFFLREKMRVKKITGFLSIRSQHSSANKIQELHTGFEAEDLRQLTQFFLYCFFLIFLCTQNNFGQPIESLEVQDASHIYSLSFWSHI